MGSRMFITESWREFLQRHGLASAEAVWESAAGTVLKAAPSTEVRRLELAGGATRRVLFVKKYRVAKPAQLWNGLFRGTLLGRSKVRREFANLAQLRAWGRHAPEPVAWGEVRRGGFVVRSFLITEGVPEPVVSLDRFIRDVLPALPPDERSVRRRELIFNLADATRWMHERRFVHGDLFWRNIILGHGGRLDAFYLIDAHASRIWRGKGWRHRAADLAALDAPAPWFLSRVDRLRFLLRYLVRPRLDPGAREFVRQILGAAEPIRERQLKRVRQLRN